MVKRLGELGWEHTAAQAQNLDVITGLGPGEGEDGGREKHSLIIGMRDQQADPLVVQHWEPPRDYPYSIEVE